MRTPKNRNPQLDWFTVLATVVLSFASFGAAAQTPEPAATSQGAPRTGLKRAQEILGLKKKPAKKVAVRKETKPARPMTGTAAAPARTKPKPMPKTAQTSPPTPKPVTGAGAANGNSKLVRKNVSPENRTTGKRGAPVTKSSDGGNLRADGASSSMVTTVKLASTPPPPPTLSLVTQLVRSQSLYNKNDGTFKAANDIVLIPTWRFTEGWKATAILDYTQDLQDPSASDMSDAIFTISRKPWKIGETFNFGLGVAGTYALSKDSTLVKTSHGGIGGVASLGFNEGVLPTGVMLAASASLLRMVQDTQESTTGAVNKAWSSIQTLKSGYTYGKVGLAVVYYHINGLTYQNNVTEAYWHVQELGYDISKMFNVAIGHTLQGPALRANAIDSNVRLTDENNSLVYAQLTISL